MTNFKCNKIASSFTRSIKPAAIISAVMLTAACASQQKVDRVHSSIYHQQASIQQLQSDMEQVEKERQQVNAELQQLQANSSANEEQIQDTRDQLLELDTRQSDINKVMKRVNTSIASNSRSISTIQTKEQKRQAIIKEQQQRWQQITAQTDTKLANMKQQPLETTLESNGSSSANAQP